MAEAGSGGGEYFHRKQEPRCHKTHRQLSQGGVQSVLSGELQSAQKDSRVLPLKLAATWGASLGRDPRK